METERSRAAEDKNNIVYEINCIDCKAVSFGECKRSLKLRSDQQKKSVKNCNSSHICSTNAAVA